MSPNKPGKQPPVQIWFVSEIESGIKLIRLTLIEFRGRPLYEFDFEQPQAAPPSTEQVWAPIWRLSNADKSF